MEPPPMLRGEYDPILIRQIMINHADDAAGEAKNNGKNHVCFGGIIKISDVAGKKYRLKALIFAPDKHADEKNLEHFRAAGCAPYKVDSVEKLLEMAQSLRPAIVYISGLTMSKEEIYSLAFKITARYSTMSIGVLVKSLDDKHEQELRSDEVNIKKIFVGNSVRAQDIVSWVREVLDMLHV
jgi:hypothetical protein